MSKDFSRADRLGEQIFKELTSIVYQKVKDPRMGFTTLTSVELSKDLKHATVFYTVLDDKDKFNTQLAFNSSVGFIRSELAKRIKVYQVPELTFKYDLSVERGINMVNLLEKINQEKA